MLSRIRQTLRSSKEVSIPVKLGLRMAWLCYWAQHSDQELESQMAVPKKNVWKQSVVYLVPACQCKIISSQKILSASFSNNLIAKVQLSQIS